MSTCISASDSDDLCKSNILHGDPFPDGGFYVPDVKIPTKLCLVLSWVSCLDGICAGKRKTLIRVSILGRCGSPFTQRPSPLRNEFQTSVPAETSTEKSTTIPVDPLFQDLKFSPSLHVSNLLVRRKSLSVVVCPGQTSYIILVLQWKTMRLRKKIFRSRQNI